MPEALSLKSTGLASNKYAFTNYCYVHPNDFEKIATLAKKKSSDETVQNYGIIIEINNSSIFSVVPLDSADAGTIQFNSLQRRSGSIKLDDNLKIIPYKISSANFALNSVSFEIDLLTKGRGSQVKVYQSEQLVKVIKEFFMNQVFSLDQLLAVDVEGIPLKLQVKNLSHVSIEGTPECNDMKGQLIRSTSLLFSKAKDALLKIEGGGEAKGLNILDKNFNFMSMGIGGLDKEFSDIFRRAFASRVFPPDIIRKMGINHVRGLLLFGPPGCGKTLIARKIAKALNSREPKVVSGPEILDKYVGQSEANIRKLFEDAEKEQNEMGDNSELHIIIFDEIDAICKARGSTGDGTGVHDSVVNQLLAKIDGVDSLNNVLIIGMTNRKDLIDPALMRPGRLEVHIEIGLPDESGRLQILNIHTTAMRTNNLLANDVNLNHLAERTKNFTGAEIEGLVKAASSYAFERQVDVKNLKKVDPTKLRVESIDFERALDDVHPAFGIEKESLSIYYRNGIINYSKKFGSLQQLLDQLIHQVKNSDNTPILSVCLSGLPGSGKTALASYMAMKSEYPYIKLINADMLIGSTETAKAIKISNIFLDAYKTPLSLIILDDLERLIEYVSLGPRFSNVLLQTLLVLLKKPPSSEHRKILLIGTTSCPNHLEDLGIMDLFNMKVELPLVEVDEISYIVNEYNNDAGKKKYDYSKIFSDPVPIKKLLILLEMAKVDGVINYDKLVECLAFS